MEAARHSVSTLSQGPGTQTPTANARIVFSGLWLLGTLERLDNHELIFTVAPVSLGLYLGNLQVNQQIKSLKAR